MHAIIHYVLEYACALGVQGARGGAQCQIMADLKLYDGTILKGSTLPVTVEDALPDVLIVCLKHEAKVFKGVLLDSSKRCFNNL